VWITVPIIFEVADITIIAEDEFSPKVVYSFAVEVADFFETLF
jgi:hypothetical protein